MPEYATGGFVERGEVGEHGGLIPAILGGGCIWSAAEVEALGPRYGLLDRINRQTPEEP
jgi:hypothetical protein